MKSFLPLYIVDDELHIYVDVLLSIIVPDMLTMIQEYSNTLSSYCSISTNGSSNYNVLVFVEPSLKSIEERWRQKVSRRGTSCYTKSPHHPVLTDLVSSLFTFELKIN